MPTPARTAFLEALAPESRASAAADADLDRALGAAWRAAREAWPGIAVAEERFFAFVGRRAPDGRLAPLMVADLYLACACADGDRAALAAFESRYLSRLAAVLARRGSTPDTVDEVRQRVRVEVLLRDGDRPPGIEGFRGRSDLHAWLHVVGIREAARVEKRARREVLGEDDALWADVVGSDPELAYLKDTYRQAVVLALKAALDALPVDELALLRQHLADGLTIDEIGARAGVHRATAARRIERARARLSEAVRAEIERRLCLPTDEVDELIQLVRSRLDLSVRRVLGALPAGSPVSY